MIRLLYQDVEGATDNTKIVADRPIADQCSPSAEEDPKLREECGVMAVYGHPEAARQVYLGL